MLLATVEIYRLLPLKKFQPLLQHLKLDILWPSNTAGGALLQGHSIKNNNKTNKQTKTNFFLMLSRYAALISILVRDITSWTFIHHKTTTSKHWQLLCLMLQRLHLQGWIQDFLMGGDATSEKMGMSMSTFIGMINLTMVVNSTNK